MSGCCFEELEAYVFDELSPPRAAAVREHLATCPACAAEREALRAERALFAARAEHERRAETQASFAAILARSRAPGEVIPLWKRRWVSRGLGLAAAAAMIAGVFVASSDSGAPGRLGAGIDVEPPPEFSCYEGEPISIEDSARRLDQALAHVEVAYGACLLSTPPEGPREDSPRSAPYGSSDEAGQCLSSTSVTSASLRP